MYEIRQFKPALYALTLLGITGFAVASSSGGLWVLAVSAVLLNYWLVKTGRFRPLPRMVANGITLTSVAVLMWIVRFGITSPILLIGHFLVLLQIVKLFEQRANRDYAQLLVLGPLLMIAGAISTYSLIFGLIFFVYLVLALYCCLLFHLKVETDFARQMIGVPDGSRNDSAARAQSLRLGRSLRRMSGLIAANAMVVAALVFLFFPRFAGVGLGGPYQWQPSMTLTGFSESVDFQNVAAIAQNDARVATVTAMRGDEPYQGVLLLRGLTLDRYSGRSTDGNQFQWTRSQRDSQSDFLNISPGASSQFGTQYQGQVYQKVWLDPTGTNVLFALGGIASFEPREGGRFRYTRADEVLQADNPILYRMEYEVTSRERLMASPWPAEPTLNERERRYVESIDPRIRAFAEQLEVSGGDEDGPFASRRPRDARVTPLDDQIAQNIETYLKTNFSYTLDLTDANMIAGQEPLVAFLTDLRRGHCEYFAGAMTLLCQSLGMQARMVVGFKCDDYNSIGNYYTVRQLHAHAWVEVLDAQGFWLTFDPTSGREAEVQQAQSLWQRARALFSFLEHTWANSVIAYDPASSSTIISEVDRRIGRQAEQSSQVLGKTMSWVSEQRARIFSEVIGWLIVIVMGVLVAAIAWFAWEQLKLRRRAARIGLDSLPPSQRMRLAKQLAFYDQLMQLLDRHRLHRPAHLTPLEFVDSLTFLPVETFGTMRHLTEAFYSVRYGRAELDESQQRQLFAGVAQVQHSLERSG